MKMILAASALTLSFGLATAPSMAADAALITDAKAEAAAVTKAGKKTVAADRISDKEYTEACLADVFKAM